MKIGIIGAGKVGTTMGAYLTQNGVTVTGYYSRTYASADESAEYSHTKAFHSVEELVKESDTLFVTTPDGEIAHVWDCIAGDRLRGKIVCHFSGSLSSHVFSDSGAYGAMVCSIHPMYAFSGKFTSWKQFHTAVLTMEGDEEALRVMTQLFGGRLHHKILTLSADNKEKYHAAATLASNAMLGLFQTSLSLLAQCGFSQEDAMRLLKPLVQENIGAMLAKGPQEALTGPIERNDVETVRKHLAALDSENTRAIYCSIGKELTVLAQRKNPERDYTALNAILAEAETPRTEI